MPAVLTVARICGPSCTCASRRLRANARGGPLCAGGKTYATKIWDEQDERDERVGGWDKTGRDKLNVTTVCGKEFLGHKAGAEKGVPFSAKCAQIMHPQH